MCLYIYIYIQGLPANWVILSVKQIKKYWISWYSYIYKEVHTLAFAEIGESVVLKHNTEQKKNTTLHSTRYFLKMPSITLLTLSKPIVNTTHGPM